jgi:voltage-gated potassium channel
MARYWSRHRVQLGSYTALALALVAYLLLFSVAEEHGTRIPWIAHILVPAVLLATIAAAARSRGQFMVVVFLFVLVATFAILAHGERGGTFHILGEVAQILFVLFTGWVILEHVFRSAAVRPDVVLGSVCAYLLVGLLFNRIYGLVETLDPGSFQGGGGIHRDGGYFSLVTLSTLGYGDVVPVKAVARSLAALEAVVGQFYIAVIVARLVAVRVTAGLGRRPEDRPPPSARSDGERN